jgi:hypothetical protein
MNHDGSTQNMFRVAGFELQVSDVDPNMMKPEARISIPSAVAL